MTIEATRVTEPTPFPDPPEWLVFEAWRDASGNVAWMVNPHKDCTRAGKDLRTCGPGSFLVRVNHAGGEDERVKKLREAAHAIINNAVSVDHDLRQIYGTTRDDMLVLRNALTALEAQ